MKPDLKTMTVREKTLITTLKYKVEKHLPSIPFELHLPKTNYETHQIKKKKISPIALSLKDLEKIDELSEKAIYKNQEKKLLLQKKIDESYEKIKKKMVTCFCLLYTSPSPRDLSTSRMPSSA